MSSDQTKQLLEQILADLYRKQTTPSPAPGNSYLIAGDEQFLGRITDNKFDNQSILNPYGPHGSKYSTTSIWNPYSQYASPYGAYSLNNPYCASPPKLFINNHFIGHVTKNRYAQKPILPEAFIFSLENALPQLLKGQIVESEIDLRKQSGESFLEANDGAYLGSLNLSPFNSDSILNQYGTYGSQFSPQSIFNKFGTYGNPYSALSPFNQFTSTPPKIFLRGNFAAYLTKNQFLNPRVDPDEIKSWLEQNRFRL